MGTVEEMKAYRGSRCRRRFFDRRSSPPKAWLRNWPKILAATSLPPVKLSISLSECFSSLRRRWSISTDVRKPHPCSTQKRPDETVHVGLVLYSLSKNCSENNFCRQGQSYARERSLISRKNKGSTARPFSASPTNFFNLPMNSWSLVFSPSLRDYPVAELASPQVE